MRNRLLQAGALAVLAGAAPGAKDGLAVSQAVRPAEDAIYAVIHIDVESTHSGDALDALRSYARESSRQTGCGGIEVLEEPTRANHFTLVEQWSSMATVNAHEDSAVEKRLRARLQPILGSPFDERLHHRMD